MMKLDSIVYPGMSTTLSFVDQSSQKKIYENVTIIEHIGEMIHFQKDERSYLYDGENIQEADEIMLHEKFKRCYTIKEEERFILFCGGEKSFEIKGADIKGIVPINEGRFIVEYSHELRVYRDDGRYETFTKAQISKEKKDG